ncbi:hypothetical protein C8R44DRAFT_351538 [Mycena epipterygia]|nr:hypothetical protein C8R44DRAFT_351538 [Mycena epipterygia]
MRSATSSNTPPGGTAKPRMSSRHSSQGPVPLATPTSPATATTTAPTTDTLKVVQPPTPASPTFASPPTSPTATSKLPRFLQSPAQRDRSKSLSVDRPSSAASSSASHGTTASYTTNTSNSTSTSSASGRRSATRFLGLGKDKERERERQRIREAERGAPSAAELLTLHESQQASPTSLRLCAEQPAQRLRHCAPAHTLRAPFLCIHTPALFQFFQLWPRTATRLDPCAYPESIRRGRPAGDAAERVVCAFGGEHERLVDRCYD